jgi:GntR family transcriptional regulator
MRARLAGPEQSEEGRPLYQRLTVALRSRILAGALRAGAQLPPERELSEQFGVSRATVRQALDQLSQAGMLTRVQGRGTFVTAQGAITQPLDRVTAFREALAAQGMVPGLRLVERTAEAGDVVLSRLLGVPPDVPLTRLVCLGLGNDEPLAVYRSYVAAGRFEETVDAFCEAIGAGTPPPMVSELYAQRRGLAGLRAEQTFESRVAAADDLALLRFDAPAAVFHVTSLIFTPDGEPVEYRQAVYRGDRYKFNMERRLHIAVAFTGEGTR